MKENGTAVEFPFSKDVLLANLLEYASESALLVVDKEARIVFVSKRLTELFALDPGVITGNIFYHAIPLITAQEKEIDADMHPVTQALKGHPLTVPFFCMQAQSNGEKRPVLACKATPIIDGTQIRGAVVQLRPAGRNIDVAEMKTMFVSFAAHQLKTPSGVVKGFLELLIREGENHFSPSQWENIVAAYEANEQLIEVSETLLNITRLEGGLIAPHFGSFAPGSTLLEKISMHKGLMEAKGISFEFAYQGVAGFISDERIIAEIFGILLNNAIKYAPESSQVVVLVRCSEKKLFVQVCDQGPGLSEDLQRELFTQAVQKDEYHTGHGLGLHLAKKYVSLLKGVIAWKPGDAGGSIFEFEIPHMESFT